MDLLNKSFQQYWWICRIYNLAINVANHCSVVPIVLIVDVGIKVRVNVGVQTNVGVHVETAVETAARGLAVRIAPVHHWLLATHRHTHGVPAQRT